LDDLVNGSGHPKDFPRLQLPPEIGLILMLAINV
jgi:hypothetical protein